MDSNNISDPNENDILLGRGGTNNQHNGNESLRNIARNRCKKYRTMQKKEKSTMSRAIITEISLLKPPGRFLRNNGTSWQEVDSKTAREKVSQVLRDAIQEEEKLIIRVIVLEGNTTNNKEASTKKQSIKRKESAITRSTGKRNTRKPTDASPESKLLDKVRVDEGYKKKKTSTKQPIEQNKTKIPVTLEKKGSHEFMENNCIENQTFSNNSPLLSHPAQLLPTPRFKASYNALHGRVPTNEASLNRRHPIENITRFATASSFPYQVPVTPSTQSSKNATLTIDTRRQSCFQESPLVHGYHRCDPYTRYPFSTPNNNKRQDSVPSPNANRLQGVAFSPSPMSPPGYQFNNTGVSFLFEKPSPLLSQATRKGWNPIITDRNNLYMVSEQQQLDLIGTGSHVNSFEFDSLFNDEVSSDSEHKLRNERSDL